MNAVYSKSRPFVVWAGLALALIAGMAAASDTVGWRTDGTGRYPDAQPPRVWGPDKNVVWRTSMPAFSVSIPVIVGERIFTCAEPAVLICVNKADGKILWQRESSYQDLNIPPDVQEKFEVERRQAEELDHQRSAIEKEMGILQKQVREKQLAQEQADPKLKQFRAETDELRKKVAALPVYSRYSKPYMHPTGGVSMCTPVCDGRRVYVGFGNGLVACYDLEGNRQWLRLIEHSTAGYGHASSPVLIGDKLLVHYADLVALDVKDGSELWRDKIPPKHGTVRVEDGKILADKLGQTGENSPIVQDGIVYWLAGSGRAVRLPKSIDDKPESLWKGNFRGGGYWFSSPVYYEGLLYLINANRSFSVIDAVTGTLVYEMKLDIGGQMYPSISMAGGVMFISSDTGETILLQPGREYHEIGRNTLETFRSTSVFEGKRMYVRTMKYLYCFEEGATKSSTATPLGKQ
jgi:outer membrane protein assembly factor BamB